MNNEFDFENGVARPINLIVVADAKNAIEYEAATRLKNLLAEIGRFEVALWDVSSYKQNQPTLKSSQRVVFIGENDASRPNISSINWKDERLNMRYGWIGTVAMLQILPRTLDKGELEVFTGLCKQQSKEVKAAKATGAVVGGIAAVVLLGAIGLGIFGGFLLVKKLLNDKNKLLKKQYNFLIGEFILYGIDNFIKPKGPGE